MSKPIAKRWPNYFKATYMIEKRGSDLWYCFRGENWYSKGGDLEDYCCSDYTKVENIVLADKDREKCVIRKIARLVQVMSEKYYCEHCKKIEIPAPEFCCNGLTNECACMGQPIDPPFCSNECMEKINKENGE